MPVKIVAVSRDPRHDSVTGMVICGRSSRWEWDPGLQGQPGEMGQQPVSIWDQSPCIGVWFLSLIKLRTPCNMSPQHQHL